MSSNIKKQACETLESAINTLSKDKTHELKLLGSPVTVRTTRGGSVSIKVGTLPTIRFNSGTAIGVICEIAVDLISK